METFDFQSETRPKPRPPHNFSGPRCYKNRSQEWDVKTETISCTHPTNNISQWQKWRSASAVNSSLVDDPTIWQPVYELPRCNSALLNCFWTNQDYCASCRRQSEGPSYLFSTV